MGQLRREQYVRGREPERCVDPSAALFGSSADSIGLDSIDALEIALMIQQHYGVELRSEDAAARGAFGSLRALTEHALRNRVAT